MVGVAFELGESCSCGCPVGVTCRHTAGLQILDALACAGEHRSVNTDGIRATHRRMVAVGWDAQHSCAHCW